MNEKKEKCGWGFAKKGEAKVTVNPRMKVNNGKRTLEVKYRRK